MSQAVGKGRWVCVIIHTCMHVDTRTQTHNQCAVFLQGCNDIDHLFIFGWRRNYRSWRTGLLCTRDVKSRAFVLFCLPDWYHRWWFKCPTPSILLEISPVQNPTNDMYVLIIMMCLHLQGKSENMEVKVMCSGQNVVQEHVRTLTS